jgi:predicted Rossmann fold nucleotide-binding protein DprA/Smf involved in DNA uptake
MTNREFYVAVANGTINDEIIAKANDLIAKHDASNEKRKSSESKEKKEVNDRRSIVLSLLSAEPTTVEVIAEQSGLSVGQVRSALTSLVKADLAVKTEVKSGKSRKMNYSLKG